MPIQWGYFYWGFVWSPLELAQLPGSFYTRYIQYYEDANHQYPPIVHRNEDRNQPKFWFSSLKELVIFRMSSCHPNAKQFKTLDSAVLVNYPIGKCQIIFSKSSQTGLWSHSNWWKMWVLSYSKCINVVLEKDFNGEFGRASPGDQPTGKPCHRATAEGSQSDCPFQCSAGSAIQSLIIPYLCGFPPIRGSSVTCWLQAPNFRSKSDSVCWFQMRVSVAETVYLQVYNLYNVVCTMINSTQFHDLGYYTPHPIGPVSSIIVDEIPIGP